MSTQNPRALVIAISILGGAALGCTGAPASSDSGGIHLADSGAPDAPDAFAEPDGGDGTCGESGTVVGWAPLPASCLPRCTAATRAAVAACRTAPDPNACVLAATAADPTPVAHVRWSGRVLDVSCRGSDTVYACLTWQVYSCQYDLCPTGYGAYIDCLNAGGTCTAEFEALDTCTRANPGWGACLTDRGGACYAATP